MRVFFSRTQEIVRRGLRERELRAFYRDARSQELALGPALRKLRALTRGEREEEDAGDATLSLLSEQALPLAELRALLEGGAGGGVALAELESLAEDSLRQLLGWAILSCVAAVEVRAGAEGRGRRGRCAARASS